MAFDLQTIPTTFDEQINFVNSNPALFANVGPPALLQYNSLSLPWGGLFDIEADWMSDTTGAHPHCGHRDGMEADLQITGTNGVPDDQRNILANLIHMIGLRTSVKGEDPDDPTSNHWHLVK
jgi:hypothetical protein